MKKIKIKVLLIDDDEDDYILTRDWFNEFQETGCDLEWVESYQLARKEIAKNQHDIYLVDYRLGADNGLELLREAINNGCTCPFILLTGHGDREIDLEAMKAGAVDYLEKSQLTAPLLERSIRYAIERKQTEQKIRQQAALLDVVTDAIFVADVDEQILFWNKAAEHLYGWSREEAITKKICHLFPENNFFQFAQGLQLLTTNHSWKGELCQTTKYGQEIIVESRWTLLPTFGEKYQSILVVNTDITQKKQLEQQFLRAQRLESIGTLASGIAHDLNNVLAPILMTAQLLETQVKDERSRQLIPILITNAKRGANLVKQVLSFAHGLNSNTCSGSGQYTLIQLKHLLIEIEQIVKETFPKNIEIITQINQNLWTVSGDATQLHQVLMNLYVNARDAMPNGGLLKITAENLLVDENYAQMHIDAEIKPYVIITVTDTGIGIQPAIIDRIFEPFFTTKEFGKGTGLGLSTVLGIIKSHGGFIHVYSEEKKGSQFKVYLPAQNSTEIIEDPKISLTQGKGELILVVDDETAICDITKKSLEAYNYKVIIAHNGIEAIALYVEYQNEISLVLTDIFMPSMDGLTTIRTIQKINPYVKIIAVSGLATSDKISAADDIGVKAFLSKPYTATQLLQTITTVLSYQ
ncbi:response regulator [Sphaerospermopsis aphanizomenoides BCCUSP55]|uniref:hybrid sensor histidine kinase/response regulator n=1 Tax=Sphaerospermopsis aphanizomenoides TaxID=459663 RepID=UPI001908F558|nr:response regulator [Sphaerospermopsis aphanizomenoides]MBK1987072.1 response regulator [Sphaerospermopsis aphanizomenoides BCCUSP55]